METIEYAQMKSSMFNYMIDKESENAVVIKIIYVCVVCFVVLLKANFSMWNERMNEPTKKINQLQNSRWLHYRNYKQKEMEQSHAGQKSNRRQ